MLDAPNNADVPAPFHRDERRDPPQLLSPRRLHPVHDVLVLRPKREGGIEQRGEPNCTQPLPLIFLEGLDVHTALLHGCVDEPKPVRHLMPMELRDTIVWVTGASDGIGRALVAPLIQLGARVVVTARRPAPLQALVAEFGAERVSAVPADLMDTDGLAALHERACEAFGPIDVLINNAGRSQRAKALDTGMDEVRGLMELNFMVPVALTKFVMPGMVERGRGHIVVVSSVAGYVSTPQRSTYSASKFAVRGWFDSLRAELHGTGVGVCVVVPGYIRTGISRAAVGSEQRDQNRPDPVDNGLPPEHCAKVIVQAIARDRHEVHVGGKELAAIHLSRLVPGLVRRIAHKFAP